MELRRHTPLHALQVWEVQPAEAIGPEGKRIFGEPEDFSVFRP